MPTPPSAAVFKFRVPVFSSAADDIVTAALEEAGGWVNDCWSDPDFTSAYIYMAAHLLECRGFQPEGNSAPSVFEQAKNSGVKTLKSGPISATFQDTTALDANLSANERALRKTEWGALYIAIRDRWTNSPRIV